MSSQRIVVRPLAPVSNGHLAAPHQFPKAHAWDAGRGFAGFAHPAEACLGDKRSTGGDVVAEESGGRLRHHERVREKDEFVMAELFRREMGDVDVVDGDVGGEEGAVDAEEGVALDARDLPRGPP
ncbi:MAG: hypothetical protein QM757_08915 [Paludibaculum sp.]